MSEGCNVYYMYCIFIVPSFVDRVTVLETDYDKYAYIILCNDYSLFHTGYPILLVRKKPSEIEKEILDYKFKVIKRQKNSEFAYDFFF